MNPSTTPKVQYTYADGADNTVRPTALVYPNGRELHYEYGSSGEMDDAASRVASLIDADGTTHLVDYSYLGQGSVIEQASPQPDLLYTLVSLTSSNDPDTGDIYTGLDRFGRVKDLRWRNTDSNTDLSRVVYGYDRASNRIWRKNPTDPNAHYDWLYNYDAIQRLKSGERGTLNSNGTAITDPQFAQCWSLDETGNWRKFLEDDNGNQTWDLNQTRTSNSVNEITNISETAGPSWVTPAYSKAGNMTTIPQPANPTKSFTATYDAWNRLVQIADGLDIVNEYAYDGARRRIFQKTYTDRTLSETRQLYYTQPNQWQILEERNGTSTDAQRQFVWGLRYIDDCLLRDRDTYANGTLDERLYALQDANWNVTAICDASCNVHERYAYSAYGSPLFLAPTFSNRAASSFNWESLYCGYRYENATGLYHVRNRVYLSTLGSWMQRDPIGYPNGFNSYAYHAPISGVDPYGLESFCENRVHLAQLGKDLKPDGVGSTREGKISNRCNVNIYCADSCGKSGAGDELGGMTFVEDGHIHICIKNFELPDDLPLSEIAEYQRRFDALILHEMSHAADLCRHPKFHCPQPDWNKPNPPPRDLTPTPFPDPRLCRQCKSSEQRAYSAQARYICPNDRAFQRAFVKAGICHSCRHLCPEFQTKPCPQLPDECGG